MTNIRLIAIILVAFAVCAWGRYQPPAKCNGQIRVRVEWRSLTEEQKSAYMKAVVELHNRGIDNNFALIHSQQNPNWHQGAFFFPVHRYFTYAYEQELLKINPNLIFPYWDVSFLFLLTL
jgi:hypothetical protein